MVISYEGHAILTAYCKSSSGNKGRMVITFPMWKTSFQQQCSLSGTNFLNLPLAVPLEIFENSKTGSKSTSLKISFTCCA